MEGDSEPQVTYLEQKDPSFYSVLEKKKKFFLDNFIMGWEKLRSRKYIRFSILQKSIPQVKLKSFPSQTNKPRVKSGAPVMSFVNVAQNNILV